jgi:putative flippase GtrA
MGSSWEALRRFLGFSLLSGVGWLCDFSIFSLLVKLFGMQGFPANLISSYCGVTFVWFTSLKLVFNRRAKGQERFLVIFWCYQFGSILAYSQVLSLIVHGIQQLGKLELIGQNAIIVAKIIITPFNLLTNFMFMRYLTRFMREAGRARL